MKTTKYKGITITPTPTETYPQMVTFTHCTSKTMGALHKKFITLEKATKWIDTFELELWEMATQLRLEKQESRRADKELLKLYGFQNLNMAE